MDSNSPLVTVVVLNWNNYSDSKRCIQNLKNQSYDNINIILVDNGSTDKSLEKLKQEFEIITTVQNQNNLGFTGGMNRGIQKALSRDSDFILLANNDVKLPDSDVVAELVKKFQANSSLGALSPNVSTTSDSTASLRSYLPDIRNGRTGYRRFTREISDPELSYGCHYGFVLFAREILELVGGFDDKYFLYFEDIEHGARIEEEGYHLATIDSLTVKHKSHGSSSSPIGPLPSYYQARNRLIFMKNYNSGIDYGILIPIYVWWFCTRLSYRLHKKNIDGAIALFQGFF